MLGMHFKLVQILLHNFLSDQKCSSIDVQKKRKVKTHLYRESDMGKEFVIEPLKHDSELYVMTSQRSGIKPGDYILIEGISVKRTYHILEIDFYCSGPLDMFILKLVLKDESPL